MINNLQAFKRSLYSILLKYHFANRKNTAYNTRYKSFASVIYNYILSDFVPKIKTTERPQLITNSTQMIKLIIISTGSGITVLY